MSTPSRIPRYDVRNDGTGPYAVFYCDQCGREFRSVPDVGNAAIQDIGKQAVGGLLRKVPLFGNTLATNVTGDDPRYSYTLSNAQLQVAWEQVKHHFRECPNCSQIVCLSDFDERSGFCNNDSPRSDEISEAEGRQAGATIKGFADAFGLGGVLKQVSDAVQQAAELATCPIDGTKAPAGTKFCPECGSIMTQPIMDKCPQCGAATQGAKFCPECGTKIERPVTPAEICPSCGTKNQGAKFCANCGTKLI
jgi:ribosomal protein L32